MNDNYKSLKILELASWYIPEGGEFVQEQSCALREYGQQVAIAANIALPWRKYKAAILKFPHREFSIYEKDILTYRYYMRRRPMAEKRNVDKWIRKTFRLCEEYIKEQGLPQIIHAHSSLWAGYVAFLLKEKYGIPYVITEHRGRFSEKSVTAEDALKEAYTVPLQKAFSNANHIVAVSSLLIEKIKSYCLTDVPISVISNLLNVDFFSFVERKKHSAFRFVCVNHYEYLKGQDVLLDAFEQVCDEFPQCELCFVGGGFQHKRFQQRLAKMKHRQNIVFAGRCQPEEVRSQLYAADAFVLPSRVESQSVAVLEALSTGLPVVATEVVPPEVLPGNVGERVAVNDATALAQGMTALIRRYSFFKPQQISQHAHDLAAKEKVIPQLLAIFNSMLNE